HGLARACQRDRRARPAAEQGKQGRRGEPQPPTRVQSSPPTAPRSQGRERPRARRAEPKDPPPERCTVLLAKACHSVRNPAPPGGLRPRGDPSPSSRDLHI